MSWMDSPGSRAWAGDMPDDVRPARAQGYRRWPWDSWSSGAEFKFVGEQWGKTPRAMANFWRAWAKRKGKTCHAYVGCGTEGVEYVLLSIADLVSDHDFWDCDRCGDEAKVSERRADTRYTDQARNMYVTRNGRAGNNG